MTINAALVAAVALPSSTSSGSSSLLNLWYSNVPQAIRFFTAGNVGTIFFYVFDSLIYKYFVLRAATENWPKLLRRNKESVSFFLAYLSQISAQHLLNAWLVYGMHTIATKERYLKTLRESYAIYSTSMVGSTVLNACLIEIGLKKNVAFWSTILGFGVINYFVVSFVIGGGTSNSVQSKGVKERRKYS